MVLISLHPRLHEQVILFCQHWNIILIPVYLLCIKFLRTQAKVCHTPTNGTAMFGLSLFDSSPRYIDKTTVSDELVNLDRRQGVAWKEKLLFNPSLRCLRLLLCKISRTWTEPSQKIKLCGLNVTKKASANWIISVMFSDTKNNNLKYKDKN